MYMRLIILLFLLLLTACAGVAPTPETASPAITKIHDPHAHSLYLFSRARFATHDGDYPTALSLLREAISLEPGSARLHGEVAEIKLKIGQIPETLEYINKAIALDPTYRPPYVLGGVVMSSAGKDLEAADYLRKAVKLDPSKEDAYLHLALSLTRLFEYEEAVVTLKALVKLNPDSILGYYYLGRTYSQMKLYRDEDQVRHYEVSRFIDEETTDRVGEIEYEAAKHFADMKHITREELDNYEPDEWLGDIAKDLLENYFEDNEEYDTADWKEIADDLSSKVNDNYSSQSYDDLFSWANEIYDDGHGGVYLVDGRSEIFNQPDGYDSETNKDDFEGELSDDQKTVVNKYKELGEMMQKNRPDAEIVTDDNNMDWIETKITDADRANPIIAFQEEGANAKAAVDFMNEGKATLHIFNGADISSLAHEIGGHIGRRFLEKLADQDPQFAKDYEAAKKWAGVKDEIWTRKSEEKYARGFERYLREGAAPKEDE